MRAGLAVTPAVEVRGLRFGYGELPALRGIDLAVQPGECVGVVGPNGAGKSTLLLHLNGILPERLPAEPCVFVDGRPLSEGNLFEIRRKVGLLFQDPDDQIFCPTVFEDVAFGPQQLGLSQAELRRTVAAALAQVRLDGFETRSAHHLSLGEKRRVCLAGVLACQPSLLVLDEPTSGLDPRGKRELAGLLRSLPATRIVASHDLDLVAALCSRVLVLDGGLIVASGPTGDVLADEALMLAHGLEKPHSLLHPHPHRAAGEWPPADG
ncbi:MAG: energy-coupling factor ABC transporter ATP-binding protein [Betaproteobacteria bacterium]